MTHKVHVKFYAADASGVSHHDFVPVLHTWIQSRAVADHVLIDVNDYSHVHNGPGTLLVAHEANFYLDTLDGFLGLSYSRKQPLADGGASFADNLRYAFAAALEACQRLEQDLSLAGRLKFRTDEATVKLNDRLAAPNTAETFQQVRPELDRVAAQLWPGATVDIEHYPGELALFEARLRSSDPADVATLLSRIATPAASR